LQRQASVGWRSDNLSCQDRSSDGRHPLKDSGKTRSRSPCSRSLSSNYNLSADDSTAARYAEATGDSDREAWADNIDWADQRWFNANFV
jgi:hypothetical protein